MRVVLWAGERVRKREVGGLDELVLGVDEPRVLGVFGMEGRTAGMGGRGLLIVVDEGVDLVTLVNEEEGVDLVTLPVLVVGMEADLVTLPVLATGVGVSGSGVVGDVVRRLSLADLVIMRDTKVSSWSSMDSVAAWALVWLLLSSPVSRD